MNIINVKTFIIQIKMSGEKQKVRLCKEYRDFFAKIEDYNRNKYSFSFGESIK